MKALRSEFPECCGATCVYNFYNSSFTGKLILGRFTKGHLYFAILADHQVPTFGPILLKAKFRLISDNTINSNTGNRLYVYLRDPVYPKPEPIIKSVFRRR